MNHHDLSADPDPWIAGAAPGPWRDDLLSLLDHSQALAVGCLRLTGEVRWLNRGMHTLLGGAQPDRPRADYLVNPDLAQLGSGAGDGLVFSGWLSVGDRYRQTHSLRAQVWRRGEELLIAAEFDNADLQRLHEALSSTNQEINTLQRELIRKNARLTQTLNEADRQLQALRDSEQRLRRIVEHIADPVMVTDAAGHIRAVNPAFTRVTGYAVEEVIGRSPSLLRSGRHPPAFFQALWEELRTAGQWRGVIWNRRKDGAPYVQRLSISSLRDSSGEDLYVAVYNDISQEIAALEQARSMAEHDALTGLPNRVLLFDRLHAALTDAAARDHLVAVLMIDLDAFKPINDQHGHAVGDSVLQIVARRLARSVRTTDTAARLGGDEFVVVLRDLPAADPAHAIRRQIEARLQAPLRLKGLRLRLGASIGMALGSASDTSAEALLARADAAMYAAKRAHQGAARGA